MKSTLMKTILKVIALALSIAVIVLGILGNTTVETEITLLGIGLLAVTLALFL
jgi:hypothetical protein